MTFVRAAPLLHRAVCRPALEVEPLHLLVANYFFARDVCYETSRVDFDDNPHEPEFEGKPEVALMGHSNAGKSSLLNALSGDPTDVRMARVGKTPGCTKMLNFYRVAAKELVLTDLMGYGAGSRAEWGRAVESYFHRRKPLRHVAWLLPAFQDTLSDGDLYMLDVLLRARLKFTLVVSQVDRVESTAELLHKLDELYRSIVDRARGRCKGIVCTSVNPDFTPRFDLRLMCSRLAPMSHVEADSLCAEESAGAPPPRSSSSVQRSLDDLLSRRVSLGRITALEEDYIQTPEPGTWALRRPGVAELQVRIMEACGLDMEYWTNRYLKTPEGMLLLNSMQNEGEISAERI